MNFRRLKAVTKKEALHILRDPRSLTLALALPLVMLLLFGYALTLDVDRIPTYVYDLDRSPESRDLIQRFEGSRYFSILGAAGDYATIERAIDRSRILLAVVIPRDYARTLLSGRPARVQLLIDGSDSNTAAIALGYAESVVASQNFDLRKRKNLIEPQLRVWYNSDLKSRNFIVPGMIAVTLMIIASLLTSLTIAREWENGTMEQLLSTPLRPSEIVLGKLLAYFALGLIDMAVCVFVGLAIFHVPFRGSPWLLLLGSCLFLFGALCWGIFISASTRSQLLAYQLGLLSSFLPAFLLSGFIYSIGNMPGVIQAITYLVPARYFVTIVNGVFLKGVGLRMVLPEMLLLLLYAALVFVAASRKMRQKLA